MAYGMPGAFRTVPLVRVSPADFATTGRPRSACDLAPPLPDPLPAGERELKLTLMGLRRDDVAKRLGRSLGRIIILAAQARDHPFVERHRAVVDDRHQGP